MLHGNPLWRCSGTLISATLFLTAGHCTEAPAAHVEIWFDADVESGIPANGLPVRWSSRRHAVHPPEVRPQCLLAPRPRNGGPRQAGEAANVRGPADAGPAGSGADQARVEQGRLHCRGLRPAASLSGRSILEGAAVRASAWLPTRGCCRSTEGSVGTESLLLSNNTNTGGTCFGDSGGPNFIGRTSVIAGVTSFGNNGTCAGTGGVYRVDRRG